MQTGASPALRRADSADSCSGGLGVGLSPACELTVTVDVGPLIERIAAEVVARMALPESSPWMDVNSAAEYLACSPQRIRKLVARRELPYHQERPGGRVFFHRGELDEWLLGL